jgi:hypothetical protein
MAQNKTAEQVRDEHLQVLGRSLGPLYHALHEEVTWLHAKWKQYRILFAESPERIALLNGAAGFFFRVVQDVLWEDVVFHIARLNDVPKSMGHDNLALSRLAEAVQEPALSLEVATLVERAKTDATFTRDWRNKHLAHRDLSLAIDRSATPLPVISREKVELALASIRAVLNKINGHFFQTEIDFAPFLADGDAESLVYYLIEALEAERRQRDRLLKGCPLQEDL